MTNEHRSKFRDRARSYNLQQKIEAEAKEEIFTPVNVLKAIIGVPLIIAGYVKKGIDHINNDTSNAKKDDEEENNKFEYEYINDKKLKGIGLKSTHNFKLRDEQRKLISKRNNTRLKDKDGPVLETISPKNKSVKSLLIIEQKGSEILKTINKQLIKKKFVLEELYSEYYALDKYSNDPELQSECQKKIKRIKEILKQIDKIKSQYKFLEDNSFFEDIVDLEDSNLVDKIIEYKDLCTSIDDKRALVQKYKNLEDYAILYDKITNVDREVEEFKTKKEQLLFKYKIRDEDFKKFEYSILMTGLKDNNYEEFLKKQQAIFDNISSKVGVINSEEKTFYHFNNFSALFTESFKYLGLLFLSPLSGLFPSIIIDALATKKLIRNLRDSLEVDQVKKIIYSADNFEQELNNAIYSINDADSLINSTLEEITYLKEEYFKKFSKYQYKFPNYAETIKKLEKIESKILQNKQKMNVLKNKLDDSKKINANKLRKVKKLNDLP